MAKVSSGGRTSEVSSLQGPRTAAKMKKRKSREPKRNSIIGGRKSLAGLGKQVMVVFSGNFRLTNSSLCGSPTYIN